jgi:hypothetical protein
VLLSFGKLANPGQLSKDIFAGFRNGVIDREELRALLESTDSGAQYSLTVRTWQLCMCHAALISNHKAQHCALIRQMVPDTI